MSAYDVVVIGAGLAGHCAALAADEQGARVLLLEKQSKVGGSTVLSGGFFAFADTLEQASAGISDNAERLREDLWEVSGREADPALLDAYVAAQSDTSTWLREAGAEFLAPVLSSGQSVPRSHRSDPERLIELLHRRARGRVEIRTSAPALRLLVEARQVVGVRTATEQGTEDVHARAVILCTGGFAHDAELVRTFAPGTRGALTIGGSGNHGDGLRMGWEIGADLKDMGWVKGTFGTHPETTTPQHHSILLTFYQGAVIVNRSGTRFVDESLSYKDIGSACLQQEGRIGYQVFDERIAKASPAGVPLFDLSEAISNGTLLVGDDLDEVATRAGVDGQSLVQTIERYNEVAGGRRPDVLGRSSLCFGSGELQPISTPPFYLYPSTTALLATYCGLRIDPKARVMNVWGERIPGLFAAGEVTGGFHGAAYMTGSSLGKAAVFGLLAGRSAAVAA